jgi:hypothetical protein
MKLKSNRNCLIKVCFSCGLSIFFVNFRFVLSVFFCAQQSKIKIGERITLRSGLKPIGLTPEEEMANDVISISV